MSEPVSFHAQEAVHRDLEELFLAHQERLLDWDFVWAARLLGEFDEALRLHVRHEEELLLPLYDHPQLPHRARAEVFTLEHARIVELLEQLHARLRELRRTPGPRPRRLLSLLDREARFKHLLRHHDAREREFFWPELDRRTSVEEREELLTRCEREWRALRPGTAHEAEAG